MARYVAFLRAINVGGRVVKMDRLRALFEAMKLGSVETFIASGNVLFDARTADTDALETRIEKALEKALGYEVLTFVRSPAEVAAAAAYEPFGDPAALPRSQAIYVGFLKAAPQGVAWETLLARRSESDGLDLRGREVYWRFERNLRAYARTAVQIEKALGPTTMRMVSTVRKLAAKVAT